MEAKLRIIMTYDIPPGEYLEILRDPEPYMKTVLQEMTKTHWKPEIAVEVVYE